MRSRVVLLVAAACLLACGEAQYRRKPPQRPGRGKKPDKGLDYYKILGVPRSADDRAIKKVRRGPDSPAHPRTLGTVRA